MGGHVARRDDAGSPGSDGASPYLRRGFPRCLAYDVTPYAIGRPIDEEFMGVTSQGRMTRKAPVRTEPHPT